MRSQQNLTVPLIRHYSSSPQTPNDTFWQDHGKEWRGSQLSHVDCSGRAAMVDVSGKPETRREAVACGSIYMSRTAFDQVKNNMIAKGDVLTVAKVAGIQAVKRTADLIPMCHPLSVTHIELQLDLMEVEEKCGVNVRATVRTSGQTGVEMEALMGVTVAALTVYDMCKSVDKRMVIGDVKLLAKKGGKSGEFVH